MERFLREQGSRHTAWQQPDPDGRSPESEWGLEPRMAAEAEAMAEREGWRVAHLSFEDPISLSPLVADVYRWWYADRGMRTDRLLVESFILLDPRLALETASVPFWTKFSVEPDAVSLERYLADREHFGEAFITAFSHGVESIGLATPERWRDLIAATGAIPTFVGVDPRRFPRDFGVFPRFHEHLQRYRIDRPLPRPLALEEFEALLRKSREHYEVAWSARDPADRSGSRDRKRFERRAGQG